RALVPHGFQHSDLCFGVETVATFRLDRRCPVFEKTIRKSHVEFRSSASRFNARQNAASARENFHVRCALYSPFIFIHARAGENGMGVGIDESRQDDFSIRVELGQRSIRELIGRAGPFDKAIANSDRAVASNPEFPQFSSAPRLGWTAHSYELLRMNDVPTG